MAATQVARSNSFSGFDEFVNLSGSPSVTPRMSAARAAPTAAMAPQPAVASSSSISSSSSTTTSVTPINMRTVGLDEKQPPPPPGSSPEALFRYYLAAELRKAGTQPDEALLDRYVKNHFESLFKNKQLSKATGAQAPASQTQAQQSQPQQQPQQQQQQQTAEPVSLHRLPAAARPRTTPKAASPPALVTAPVAGPSQSDRAGSTPPSMVDHESPSPSDKTFSPVSTPRNLPSVQEDEGEMDFSKAFKDASSMDFAAPGLDSLDFGSSSASGLSDSYFRASPFRMGAEESASIDPHMVQLGSLAPYNLGGQEPLAAQDLQLPTAVPVAREEHQDDMAAMSEDGMSDQEDDGDSQKAQLAASLGLGQQNGSQFTFFKPMRIGSENVSNGGEGEVAQSRSNESKKTGLSSAHDLKPDPEEYKKLSSKEKRQLRNKISARNFRTRRKEYISHLEEQVADRDSIIEGLRSQLSLMSMENKSLQEEVRILKTRTISSTDVSKILEVLQKNLPPINTTLAPSSSSMAGVNVAAEDASMAGPATPSAFVNFVGSGLASGENSRPATPTSSGLGSFGVPSSPRAMSPRPSILRRSSPSIIPQANTKKDVGPQSSFWGGVGSANGQSYMPVC